MLLDLASFYLSLLALVAMVALMLVQALVADVARMRAGMTPGVATEANHESFVFRAERAHANSLENLPVFALVAVVAILIGASPSLTNGFCFGYVIFRGGHMLCYYADARLARSIAFTGGLICTGGLTVSAALRIIALA